LKKNFERHFWKTNIKINLRKISCETQKCIHL